MSKNKKERNAIQRETPETDGPVSDSSAAKKAIVLGTEKKNRKPLIGFLVLVTFLSGSAFFIMSRGGESTGTAVVETPYTSTGTASQVTYPVAMFADGQARHFAYKEDGHDIKYFVLKSSDGVIRAAFDACDVCWPAGKGYYQDGDVMVCRNCGRRFASVRVNEVKGGCNPAPLYRTVEGDQLVIQVKDIVDGKRYFDFSGKV
jgi:uncharacterized membrane protein